MKAAVLEERPVPGIKHGAHAALDPTHARLAVHAEVGAEVDAAVVFLDAVDGHALTAFEDRRLAQARDRVRAHERVLPAIERLVELGGDVLLASDLRSEEPFAAQRVDPGAAVERAQIVGRIGAEVRREAQAEEKIVRSPRLLHRCEAKHRLVALAHHAVVERK